MHSLRIFAQCEPTSLTKPTVHFVFFISFDSSFFIVGLLRGAAVSRRNTDIGAYRPNINDRHSVVYIERFKFGQSREFRFPGDRAVRS
jgi:hypothetical protein